MSEEFKSAQKKKSYQEHLEKLVAAKPLNSSFDVKVRANKENYEINNNIVFNVTSDKNGYLTMLDINPDGDICVIFPNKFQSNNLIRAGEIYKVPSPNTFKLKIRGPSGLERIKAFVTLNKFSLLKLDLDKEVFHCIKKETNRGTEAIQALSKQIDSMGSSSWAEAYSEIFIFKEGEKYTIGSRKIPILE